MLKKRPSSKFEVSVVYLSFFRSMYIWEAIKQLLQMQLFILHLFAQSKQYFKKSVHVNASYEKEYI